MKIYFFQDNSFFRTKEGTNPFFDPIIRVCEENGIEWKVWTTNSTKKCGYDKSHVGYLRTINFLWTWYWRAHRILNKKADPELLQLRFGKIMRLFYGKKLKAEMFVTIAGNQCCVLSGMFLNVRNVDLQHGVIYSKHNGYFTEDRRLRKVYQEMKNREFWLYGKGYADCFFKHPDNAADLEGRVKVIGDVFGHEIVSDDKARNLVVISAQFKPDYTKTCMEKQVVLLRNFLKEFKVKYLQKYKLLIKHHPRFKGIESLHKLYKEFPWLEVTQVSWQDLYSKMFVHVTFSSTVVFDAASNGIPSFLMAPPPDEQLLENWFWKEDYAYPYAEKTFDEVMELAKLEICRSSIKSWYDNFYTPFAKESCLNLINIRKGN